MIRKIQNSDKNEYKKMAEDFYSSSAVSHKLPLENFENAFNMALKDGTYIRIYILEYDGKTAGYASIAVTSTTEGGGLTLWLDELYVKEQYRGKGLGGELIAFLKTDAEVKRIRLEITPDNSGAEKLYKSLGFCGCEYRQLIWDRKTGE